MNELELYIDYLKQDHLNNDAVKLLESIKVDINNIFNKIENDSINFVENIISNLFKNLLLYPITLNPNEWENDINIRNNNIYKSEGKYYFNNAVLFHSLEENLLLYGECEGITSLQEIKSFPFVPKIFNVVVKKSNDDDYFIYYKDDINIVLSYFS